MKTNKITEAIKDALIIKKVSLESNQIFGRFVDSDAIRNMKKIASGKETQLSDYQLFLEKFKGFLDKEFLGKVSLKQPNKNKKFRDLVLEYPFISFYNEGLKEEKITEKKKMKFT
jgi:hypothetical protein